MSPPEHVMLSTSVMAVCIWRCFKHGLPVWENTDHSKCSSWESNPVEPFWPAYHQIAGSIA